MQMRDRSKTLIFLLVFIFVAALSGYWATGQIVMALAMMICMVPIVMSVATRH